jgi:integrase
MTTKLNFTKAALDALTLPVLGQRSTFYDTKSQGLQIRVASSGIKTFSVFRRIKGGQPERITLGRYPALTIEQARRKTAEVNALIENGSNPADLKRTHRSELTFEQLFKEYLERHAKPRKRTWEEDASQFRQYLNTPLGNKKLSHVRRSDIATIHSDITRAGHTTTANRVLALISSIYGWAISAGLWEANPAKGIKRNPEKSRDRFLQSDELPRFFAALTEEPNHTIRDYILIALLTGMRRANVLSMRWQDINFERAEWRIQRTKNNDPQTVTLTPEVIEILHSRHTTESPYVFPSASSAAGHLMEPKKGWQRVLARAGITDLRIHDLRRTLGSWQAKTGASLVIIGKSLNHKSPNTTAIYSRLDLDPVRESIERATSAILIAAGVKRAGTIVPIQHTGST